MVTFTQLSVPGIRAAKFRDLNLLRLQNDTLVFACDSVGSVGMLPFDAFRRTPEEAGKSYSKCVLMELLAAGADITALYGDFCYAAAASEEQICQSIRTELSALGLDPSLFRASFGSASNPKCTAFGITAVGRILPGKQRLGTSQPGDRLYAVGIPSRKDEQDAQCTPGDVQKLLAVSGVHEILPCGSHGIAGELAALAQSSGLSFEEAADHPLCGELELSCGPSAVVLVSAVCAAEALEALGLNKPITLLGTLTGCAATMALPASDTPCTLREDGTICIGDAVLNTACAVSLGKGMKAFDGPVRVPSENIVRRLAAGLIDEMKADGSEPLLVVNNLNISMKGGGKGTIAALRELIEPFQMKPDFQLTGSTEDNHEAKQSGYALRIFGLRVG